MNGCSAENADLDKLVKDHPAEMEVLSEEIFYQSVPEQVICPGTDYVARE